MRLWEHQEHHMCSILEYTNSDRGGVQMSMQVYFNFIHFVKYKFYKQVTSNIGKIRIINTYSGTICILSLYIAHNAKWTIRCF